MFDLRGAEKRKKDDGSSFVWCVPSVCVQMQYLGLGLGLEAAWMNDTHPSREELNSSAGGAHDAPKYNPPPSPRLQQNKAKINNKRTSSFERRPTNDKRPAKAMAKK